MKAKLVRENLEFEREGTPLKKIGIGEAGILKDIEWDKEFNDGEIVEEYMYKGWPIRIIKTYFGDIQKDHPNAEYVAISHKNLTTYEHHRLKWYKTARWAKTDMERRIDELTYLQFLAKNPAIRKQLDKRPNIDEIRPFIDESMDFERGIKPKEALGIGQSQILGKKLREFKELDNQETGRTGYIKKLNVKQNGNSWILNVYTENADLEGYLGMLMKKSGLKHYIEDLYSIDDLYPPDAIYHYKIYNKFEKAAEDLKDDEYFIKESLDFERGQDPKASLGIGKIPRIPIDIIKADLESGYGIDGEPGAIFNVEVIGPRRFVIKLLSPSSYGSIRNLTTNKVISRQKYAQHLVNKIGIGDLITNVNHAHGTGNHWIFTLAPEYKDMMPRETYTKYDLNESLNFERDQDPKSTIGIGYGKKVIDAYKGTDKIVKELGFEERPIEELLQVESGWSDVEIKFLWRKNNILLFLLTYDDSPDEPPHLIAVDDTGKGYLDWRSAGENVWDKFLDPNYEGIENIYKVIKDLTF